MHKIRIRIITRPCGTCSPNLVFCSSFLCNFSLWLIVNQHCMFKHILGNLTKLLAGPTAAALTVLLCSMRSCQSKLPRFLYFPSLCKMHKYQFVMMLCSRVPIVQGVLYRAPSKFSIRRKTLTPVKKKKIYIYLIQK